jgi:LysR family transcriptional activator of nhaA
VVAKEESIQRASTLLNVSPSSISEQIKVLETRVGVNLFDRSQKKMTLASSGKAIFEKLDLFFPQIEELFESLINHKHVEVKLLKIGFCPTLSKEIRFKLCFGLIEDPYYTVKIHQGDNNFLVQAFNRDEIDLIFSTNNHIAPKGNYKKYSIGPKKFSLVCNKELYQQLKNKKGLEVIQNQRFINFTSDSELHFKIYDLLKSNNIHPIRIAEIDDINLIKGTISKFNSFAFLPDNSIVDELKEGSLKKIQCNTQKLNTKITAFYKPKFESERFTKHLIEIKKTIL